LPFVDPPFFSKPFEADQFAVRAPGETHRHAATDGTKTDYTSLHLYPPLPELMRSRDQDFVTRIFVIIHTRRSISKEPPGLSLYAVRRVVDEHDSGVVRGRHRMISASLGLTESGN
jgi:hypothetical protein